MCNHEMAPKGNTKIYHVGTNPSELTVFIFNEHYNTRSNTVKVLQSGTHRTGQVLDYQTAHTFCSQPSQKCALVSYFNAT